MIKVSKRLKAIGDFVPDGSVLVDIGTDHALLIIYLLQSSKIKQGFGLDIAKKPLESAQENLKDHDLENKVELVLSDGLKSFTQRGDAYVVAGMGAETIWKIIKDYDFKENDTLILQANSKQAYLREKLSLNSFVIVDESFIIDMKRTYTILKVKPSQVIIPLNKLEQLLGPILMKENNPKYIEKIKNRRNYLETLKNFNQEMNEEFSIIDEFLKEQNYE